LLNNKHQSGFHFEYACELCNSEWFGLMLHAQSYLTGVK